MDVVLGNLFTGPIHVLFSVDHRPRGVVLRMIYGQKGGHFEDGPDALLSTAWWSNYELGIDMIKDDVP